MNTQNRSVSAGGNITGSIIQTGDHNRADLQAVQLPPPESVDIGAAVAALRDELLALDTPLSGKIERALEDAAEEASGGGDKAEVGDALTRALRHAEKASNFAEHLGKIQEQVTKIAGWLGAASPYAPPLLAAVGLSIG